MANAVIRPARPDDADFLGWAILAASRGHLPRGWFDIALGRPESLTLEFAKRLSVAQAPSWWHYSRFVLAEVGGKAVGALAEFRAGEAYPLSQAAMEEVAGVLGMQAADRSAIWQRGSYIFLCAMEGGDDGWTVENIAVLPSHRGLGLTRTLLERAVEDGRQRRLSQAQITFFIGNQSAERAYAKAGFHIAAERRHPDFEAVAGAPGLRRVVRSL